MRHVKSRLRTLPMMAAVSILLASCATISLYSEAAHQQTINLKVDTLSLMDKATDPYAEHQDEVLSLMRMIDKAYEYALGRPKNEISAEQWAVLRNPDGHLVGGFMRTWKEKGQLSKTFIDEVKGVVGDAFDTISALETGKPKAKDTIIGGGH